MDYNPKAICSDLRKINWAEFHNLKRVNDARGLLQKQFTSILNTHAPLITKKVEGKTAPCVTDDVKATMNESAARLIFWTISGKEVKLTKLFTMQSQHIVRNLLRENSHDPKKL